MLHRLLNMIQSIDDLSHDDYKDRIRARNKLRGKILLVLFGIILAGCLFVRIIT